MNYNNKRECAFEKLQTLCNHVKDGLEKIDKSIKEVDDLGLNENSVKHAKNKLTVAKQSLTQALEASRAALGQVGETYSERGFIENSGHDFAEQVVMIVYSKLKSVLEPLSKPF
jgi:hypothetical protein